ncbi:PKD domain-containing protein [Chloroflexota bacterium]
MNRVVRKVIVALLIGLAATVTAVGLLSTLNTQAATAVDNSTVGENAEACTIGVATGNATVDNRPVLWKNRDYFGRPDAWQSILFWHQATGHTFSISDPFGDRFNYVAVSDWGDWSDPQDITETLRYPRMGANEKGLGVVLAQAHTLSSKVQSDTVGFASQDPKGIRNGGLLHWLLSRCETITDVQELLTVTNDGGGYNGSTARDTAALFAVIDRFGGAAIFEVDGNSFARQNITKAFTTLDKRPHSSGPPAGEYTGFDYRSNFSRINFTNTNICSDTLCFPYFPDDNGDGVNDLEYSTSSIKRWGRVEARMDDALRDYQYFIQKWLRKGGHPREFYLETIARSVGYAPYLSSSAEYAWTQEKLVGYHLNRFVTVSSAVIVGSKAGDQDEGRLTTMWVALGEPSVAIFVPVFPYAGKLPAILDNFFLSINAKRRLVYNYEKDTDGYPVDNIDSASPYSRWRNADHSIDLSALFGGNYYGEGGVQAYNFVIEEELYRRYEAQMDEWRKLPADQITPAMLADWQETQAAWAVEEYVKSDPTVAVYQAETDFNVTSGQVINLNDITAWRFSREGSISRTQSFSGATIIEVIARGTPDNGDWPGIKVWLGNTCLSEVGGETGVDCTVVVSPTHATNKAKSVKGDLDGVTSRFALYRYRTTHTGPAEMRIEIVSATVTATVDIDKVLLRTEPRSVEMYEVEKDWDAKSIDQVEVSTNTILLTDTKGFIDIYHYVWGEPLIVEVVAKGFSTNPSPVISLTCKSQLVGTATLTTEYAVYPFDWDPGSAGQVACRIRPANYKDIRVDKLLIKENLPVKANTAPAGCFTINSTVNSITTTINASANVTDPAGDAIASYCWDFGDRDSYCSGNPEVTHIYSTTTDLPQLTLFATDHRGKTATISEYCTFLPVVLKNSK